MKKIIVVLLGVYRRTRRVGQKLRRLGVLCMRCRIILLNIAFLIVIGSCTMVPSPVVSPTVLISGSINDDGKPEFAIIINANPTSTESVKGSFVYFFRAHRGLYQQTLWSLLPGFDSIEESGYPNSSLTYSQTSAQVYARSNVIYHRSTWATLPAGAVDFGFTFAMFWDPWDGDGNGGWSLNQNDDDYVGISRYLVWTTTRTVTMTKPL